AYFFFQAEDGIRDRNVTGVQTCALPICERRIKRNGQRGNGNRACQNNQQRADRRKNGPSNEKIYQRNFLRRGFTAKQLLLESCQIGRASCREGVKRSVGDGRLQVEDTEL